MKLKCSCCGYDGEDFVRIDFLGRPFETDHVNEFWDDGFGSCSDKYDISYLYACPKCKTVRLGEFGCL